MRELFFFLGQMEGSGFRRLLNVNLYRDIRKEEVVGRPSLQFSFVVSMNI